MKKKFSRVIAHYLPQCLLLISILTSNVLFPATVIAQEIENTNNVIQEETVPIDTSEDILEEGISTSIYEEEEVVEPPFVFENGIYTVNTVVEGEEYVYPDNNDVRVKFTEVTQEGNLVIKRVELTEEQKELLNTKDSYGWDITSSMENGTFKYNLTLPNTQGNEDIEVKYTEDNNTYESIDNSNIEIKSNVVTIEGLDHFTLFVVSEVNRATYWDWANRTKQWTIEYEGNGFAQYVQDPAGDVLQKGREIGLGSDYILMTRPGTGGRAYLGYDGFDSTLNDSNGPTLSETLIEEISWQSYSAESPNDHYLNIYLFKPRFFGFDYATIVYIPSVGAAYEWNTYSTDSPGTLYVKEGEDYFYYDSMSALINAYGDWRIRSDSSTKSGITIVSGSSNPGPKIENYIDNVKISYTNGVVDTYTFENSTDNTSPIPSFSTTISSPTNQTLIPVNLAFNEDVYELENNDLALTNATISSFTKVSQSQYQININPVNSGEVIISIPQGAVFDATGNPNVSASLTITYEPDTIAPTSNISIKADLNETPDLTHNNGWHGGGWYYNFDNIILSISNPESGDFIQYQIMDGNPDNPGSSWTSASNQIDLAQTINAKTDGIYTIFWYAEDLAGNTETPKREVVKIDRTSPTYTIDFDSINGLQNNNVTYIKEDKIQINVNVGDALSGYTRARYDLHTADENWNCTYNSTNEDNLVPAENNTSRTLTVSGLSDGKYCLRIWVYDDVQNKALVDTNGEQWVHFIIDTTPPSTPTGLYFWDVDNNKKVECGGFSNTKHIVGHWNPTSDINFLKYEYSSFDAPNGNPGLVLHPLTTNYFDSSGWWTIPSEGTYGFQVRTVDKASNISGWALNGVAGFDYSCKINIDWTAPVVSGISITKNNIPASYVKKGDEITISATITDNLSGINAVTADFSYDSTYNNNRPDPIHTSMTLKSGEENIYETTFTIPNDWNEGDLYITVAALDNAGNYNGNRGSAKELTIDNTAPAQPTGLHRRNITGDEFECGDIAQKQTMIPDWDDISGDPTFSHFEYSSFNAPSGSQGLDEEILFDSEFVNNWVAPIDGTYGYAVRSVDKAGNKSEWSLTGESLEGSCQITYDSSLPSVPILESPIDGVYISDNTPLMQWADSNDNIAIAGYYYRVYFNCIDVNDSSTCSNVYPNSTGLWRTNSEYQAGTTSDGTYYWQVKAVDTAGNESNWSDLEKVVIDTKNPTAPTNLNFETIEKQILGCGSITNEYTIVATWDPSTDSSPITYEYRSYNPATGWIWNAGDIGNVNERQGSFTVGEGLYGFAVRAVDAAGNTSEWTSENLSESCQITYDSTDPVIADHLDVVLTEGETFPTSTVSLTDNYGVSKVCGIGKDITNNLTTDEICIDIDSSNLTEDQFKLMDVIKEQIQKWKDVQFTTVDLSIIPEGQYQVTYYATDKAGNKGNEETFTITIVNNVPTVTITAGSTQITQGNSTVLGTTVTNGNTPYTYLWSGACTGTESTTTFTGTSTGTYTCTVTVTDADGDTVTKSIDITVLAQPTPATTGGEVLGATTGPTTTTKPSVKGTTTTKTTPNISEDTQTEEILETTSIEEPSVLGERCENKKKVSGYIYIDENKDKEMNENEEGIKDITLTIQYTDEEGNIKTEEEVNTDEKGYWETQLCSGKYNIVVKKDTLPKNIEVSEVLSLTVSDNEKETIFNIQALDTRNFWQKYWYLIVGGLAIIVIGYSSIKNRKKEEI